MPLQEFITGRSDEALAILALMLAIVALLLRKTPDLPTAPADLEWAVWDELARREGDHLGVLFSEEWIAPTITWWVRTAVRRIQVTLRHREAGKDVVLFRNEENPSTSHTEDDIVAFVAYATKVDGNPEGSGDGEFIYATPLVNDCD